MTKRGHFIINGIPRIIVNQIIRASGIYYQQKVHKSFQQSQKYIYRTFFVDIISKRGVWIRFEMDKKRKIWVCMKKTPKIPLFLFLYSLGFTNNLIFKHLNNLEQKYLMYKYNFYNSNSNFKFREELKNLNINLICRNFLNPHIYDLGKIGRKRLNLKLGLNTNKTTLTPIDFLKLSYLLFSCTQNSTIIDDIDDLRNRRIRSIGELLEIQFQESILRMETLFDEKMKKAKKSTNLWLNTKPLNSALKEFFASCQLSQFLDQTNPLAELTHKRRISALGPNGIQRETAGMEIRGIHSTYFGRVCPIETPEGQNAGLVNSLTVFTRANYNGFLESAFSKVYKSQIQKNTIPQYRSVELEQQWRICFPDIRLSSLDFLKPKSLSSRYNLQLMRMHKQHMQLAYYSCFQFISLATSLIPFLEHNDANRVLMGSNMQRQAVPLLVLHPAQISGFLEHKVLSDTAYCVQTFDSGIILYADKNNIDLYIPLTDPPLPNSPIRCLCIPTFRFTFILHSIRMQAHTFFNIHVLRFTFRKRIAFYVRRKSNTKLYLFQFSRLYKNLKWLILIYNKTISMQVIKFAIDASEHKLIHSLEHYLFAFYKHKYDAPVLPFIKHIKQHYKTNNFILKNFDKTNQGTALLQKPLVSALEWVEKGDIITDCATSKNGRLAFGQNLLVGYMPWEGFNFEDAILISEQLILEQKYTSLHVEKYDIELKKTVSENDQLTCHILPKAKQIHHLDKNGIIKLGSLVKEGTILIGKRTVIQNKPFLAHEKLLYDIVGKSRENVKDTSLRAPKNTSGKIIYISINHIPYKNVVSPTSQKNWQTISLYIAEKRRIKIGDKMAGRHGNKGVISKILPVQDLPFLLNGTTLDIVLNPLGVPSRMNVGQLLECILGFASDQLKENFRIQIFDEKHGFNASRSMVYAKLFESRKQTKHKWHFGMKYPTQMPLIDGRTGDCFIHPITVGKSYIMKLIHLVDEKIHARSTGPYSLVTQQPLKGRSKHGGQRFGEMEVWAMEGFGCAYILQELLTIKSDDTKGRHKIIETILQNSAMVFGTPESFKVLLRELQSLCLNIQVCEKIFN